MPKNIFLFFFNALNHIFDVKTTAEQLATISMISSEVIWFIFIQSCTFGSNTGTNYRNKCLNKYIWLQTIQS